MALILHLSDVHLSRNPPPIGDYKSKLVPPAERINRQDAFELTIASLANHLSDRGLRLDAIAITGDVTVADDRDGFQRIVDLLAELPEPVRPEDDKIVVVPGNHDVTWATPSSTPERYSNFVEIIRGAGFSTPILRGVDDSLGAVPPTIVGLEDDRVLVVPLNSSNYCGSLEPLADRAEAAVDAIADANTRSEVVREVERLRLHDVARIVPADLRDLAAELTERTRAAQARHGHRPIKVLCLHHHLLPVSVDEELKSFESITNLGLLRNFVASQQIDVILHGHKHAGFVYFDHIYDPRSTSGQPEHRSMIVSGSTLGGVDYNTGEIARLISLRPQRSAVTVGVRPVGSVAAGGHYREAPERTFHLFSAMHSDHRPSMHPHIFAGPNVADVYDQLRAWSEGFPPDRVVHNVHCHIGDATWPLPIPRGVPSPPGSPQGWFEALVDYWQNPDPRIHRVPPSHGARIRRFGLPPRDQLADAAEALVAKQGTSRAIVTLLDPSVDDLTDRAVKFPSFCNLQFTIRTDQNQLYLDVYGYFRRQELRYWWPVNIGEMCYVRSIMFELLRASGSYQHLRPGHVSTMTAMAHFGAQAPRVSVPLVDRLFESDEDCLWDMAFALTGKLEPVAAAEASANWLMAMEEFVPPEAEPLGGSPIAVEGLAYLAREIARFARANSSLPDLATAADLLEDLLRLNESRRDAVTARRGPIAHAAWRARCLTYTQRLEEIVRRLLAQQGNSTEIDDS